MPSVDPTSADAPPAQPWPQLRPQVLDWLADQVPPKRLKHCLRVEATAIDLAARHGVDPETAAQAGLMHDLAKCYKPQRLLAMATAAGLPIDPVDRQHPHLLHADVSALVAAETFAVDDDSILAAIANHTLGRPHMDSLSAIVFLADSLEPGRGNTPELAHLRQLSQHDLPRALLQTCHHTFTQLMAQQRPIHPRALATRNWCLAILGRGPEAR